MTDGRGEDRRERREERRTVFDGRLLRVTVDRVSLPGGGRAEREVVRHPGAAAVLPLFEGSGGATVVLVRQYRHAAGEALWEVPAGTLEPGEEPEDCARREVEEEAGLRPGRLEPLAALYTSPGFTDERVHLFLAPNPERGTPSPEEGEEIELRELPLEEALGMVGSGEIRDGKSVAALLLAADARSSG